MRGNNFFKNLFWKRSLIRTVSEVVEIVIARSPISASMRVQLHWLSVESRVKFELALLAYKSTQSGPEYLSAYCVPVTRFPGRSHLRSADQWSMFVPRTKTATIGLRGFYCAVCTCPSVSLMFAVFICDLWPIQLLINNPVFYIVSGK